MLITSKNGNEYSVYVKPWGWTFVRPSVKIKKKFLGISYWKEVWDENPWGATRAGSFEQFSTKQVVEWFNSAVEQYEEHKERWGNA